MIEVQCLLICKFEWFDALSTNILQYVGKNICEQTWLYEEPALFSTNLH